jgi:hypothetical protein
MGFFHGYSFHTPHHRHTTGPARTHDGRPTGLVHPERLRRRRFSTHRSRGARCGCGTNAGRADITGVTGTTGDTNACANGYYTDPGCASPYCTGPCYTGPYYTGPYCTGPCYTGPCYTGSSRTSTSTCCPSTSTSTCRASASTCCPSTSTSTCRASACCTVCAASLATGCLNH